MVTDASLWVNYFLRQNRFHEESVAWVDHRLQEGLPMVAPALLLAEVGGAISRGTGSLGAGRRAVNSLLHWPLLEIVSWEGEGLEAALLACDLGLRGADAYYVLVAHRRSLPLISWDDDQRERARAVVPVGCPGEPLRWPGAER